LELDRCIFLGEYLEDHLKSIQDGKTCFEAKNRALSHKISKGDNLKKHIPPPEYRFNLETAVQDDKSCVNLSSSTAVFRFNHKIMIKEPSLALDLAIDFHPHLIPEKLLEKSEKKGEKEGEGETLEALIGMCGNKREGQTLYLYPNRTIKAEAYYQAGELHGPWTFYADDGKILYRSWYINGKLVGKSCAYYAQGSLYFIKGYSEGVLQGVQLHYFADGTLKTEEHYEKGVLHGDVRLYYSNGQLKKEQFFSKGKLDGRERMWNELGELLFDCYYKDGKAL